MGEESPQYAELLEDFWSFRWISWGDLPCQHPKRCGQKPFVDHFPAKKHVFFSPHVVFLPSRHRQFTETHEDLSHKTIWGLMIDTIDTWGFDNQNKIKEPLDFTSYSLVMSKKLLKMAHRNS